MVSVIIPAFNAQSSIARAIDSVLGQTYDDLEVIVIDDGSTDKTAEVIARYGDKVRCFEQKNLGPGSARNVGIRQARGRWIAFLDADDEWVPGKLAKQMGLMERHPDLRWCAANAWNVNESERSYRHNPTRCKRGLAGKDYFENYFHALAKEYLYHCTITILIRRRVFDQVGLFPEDMLRCEDTDMFCRVALKYPRIGYIPEPLAVVHLDVVNPVLTERRLYAKKGIYFRRIVSRYFPLAEKANQIEQYEEFAFCVLRRNILSMLFNGYGNDARQMVSQFKRVFNWHWQIGVFILTIWPKGISTIAKSLVYVARKVGLEKRLSRRWLHKKHLEKTEGYGNKIK